MKLVRSMLQLRHYQSLEAGDAEAGIQVAREHLPDIILMDIQLPGMDGLEATRIIRKDPILSNIPVMALTSYAMQGDEQKAISAGCAGYIAKPIDTSVRFSSTQATVGFTHHSLSQIIATNSTVDNAK